MAMTLTCAACTQQAAENAGIGIKMENLNEEVAPGSDFYEYACGGWMKNNPLKPEYARFGSFDAVAENNKEQLHQLIEELTKTKNEKGSVAQKIADYYSMVMDSVRLNKDGFKPILKEMKKIEELNDRSALLSQMIINDAEGVAGFFFGWGIGADLGNCKMNLLGLGQAGLTLGDRDYYLNDDETSQKLREAYRKHIINMFKIIGDDEETATRKMNSIMNIENKIAVGNKSRVDLRDPISNYHKMSYAELKEGFNPFPWDEFWAANGITDIDSIDVGQPEAIHNDIEILFKIDVRELKDWMEWSVLHSNSGVLGDSIENESFEFFGKTMSGKQEMQARWKRAVEAVSSTLGEAVGEMYVKKYFPAENKERMVTLVKNLQNALAERIDAQTWMSDTTKAKAKEKLQSFYVKIGYPDKWDDFSKLNIDPTLSLYEQSNVIHKWSINKMIEEKYKKPVDRDEWLMTPQTVNAYYNPTTNEICFPAGILQYPLFDMSADDAFNYGAIGVVIGHEMTHGFDDQGRQFDKEGKFSNWWTDSDAEKFKEKTKVIIDFFDKIEVLPGLNANGTLTQGENIADHGGLKIAYQAYKNATKDAPLQTINGLTPDQRFFLAYAGVWAQNITEENIRQLTIGDPHSLARWRVNGTLPHIDAWYEAFGITEKDSLFIPKEKRANIW